MRACACVKVCVCVCTIYMYAVLLTLFVPQGRAMCVCVCACVCVCTIYMYAVLLTLFVPQRRAMCACVRACVCVCVYNIYLRSTGLYWVYFIIYISRYSECCYFSHSIMLLLLLCVQEGAAITEKTVAMEARPNQF